MINWYCFKYIHRSLLVQTTSSVGKTPLVENQILNNRMKLNDLNSTIKSAKSWFLVTPEAFGRLFWSLEACVWFTSRDTSTSLTSLAISRVRTKGIMSTFFGLISPRTIFTAWCSDQRPNFSGINLGVSHGTRWNMMELYFGGGYMRLPTRIRWKKWEKMEKQQTLQESPRPFRRFEVTISFRISRSFDHPTKPGPFWN